jgi:hypothetical protein
MEHYHLTPIPYLPNHIDIKHTILIDISIGHYWTNSFQTQVNHYYIIIVIIINIIIAYYFRVGTGNNERYYSTEYKFLTAPSNGEYKFVAGGDTGVHEVARKVHDAFSPLDELSFR